MDARLLPSLPLAFNPAVLFGVLQLSVLTDFVLVIGAAALLLLTVRLAVPADRPIEEGHTVTALRRV